jgi:lysozyme
MSEDWKRIQRWAGVADDGVPGPATARAIIAKAGIAEAPPPPGTRQINAEGLALIKEFEGLELKAYLCPAKVWTIGYGSTGAHVKPGMVITEAEAEQLLRKDLARFERAVARACPIATGNQFSAMVSLAFNIGEAAFEKSTLARLHKAGDYRGAAEQFPRWNKAGGKVLAGLSRRRAREQALYRKMGG